MKHKLKAKRDALIRELVKAQKRGVTGSAHCQKIQKQLTRINAQITELSR